MKNMGFSALRLVSPAPFDPADITGIAHRCEDVLTTIQCYADLDSALADIHYVVGTTARPRSDHPIRHDLRTMAGELAQQAHASPPQLVGILFGPEDNGLDNNALDRCQQLLCLPTNPDYPSLNLSHAVLLLLYELRMAMDIPASTETHLAAEHPPPTQAPTRNPVCNARTGTQDDRVFQKRRRTTNDAHATYAHASCCPQRTRTCPAQRHITRGGEVF